MFNILTLIKYVFATLYKNELNNNMYYIDPYNWFLFFVKMDFIQFLFFIPYYVNKFIPESNIMMKNILNDKDYEKFMKYCRYYSIHVKYSVILGYIWLIYGFIIFWNGKFSLIVNIFYYSYYLLQLYAIFDILYNWNDSNKNIFKW